MVFYEVYSHAELRRYKSTIFSKATAVQLVCIVITFLCPFLIAYFAGGFWIKEKMSTEHAEVRYQYRYLVVFETDTSFYLSSSYENVNQIYASSFVPALRNIYETSSDINGRNELLQLDIFISGIPTNQVVKSVKLLLLFNNTLSTHAKVQFESIAFLEATISKTATDLSFSGELELFQTEKFIERVSYTDYKFQYLDETNVDLENLDIGKILNAYYERPYGTRLKTDYAFWTNRNTNGFNINGRVRYAPYKIMYVPAFWEQFKWGWIQYIAVLIPFLYVFRLIKIFIFENQLVPVIVMASPNKVKTN